MADEAPNRTGAGVASPAGGSAGAIMARASASHSAGGAIHLPSASKSGFGILSRITQPSTSFSRPSVTDLRIGIPFGWVASGVV